MPIIHSVEINLLRFPLKRTFSNHAHPVTEINAIDVRIKTENHVGCSFIYGLQKSPYTNVLKFIKEDMLPSLFKINDLTQLKSQWTTFWTSYKKQNSEQDKLYALASLDIAIWDLYLKEQKIPLHQYLGATKTNVPAYATTGWLSLTTNELVAECKSYLKYGINAFKLRLGNNDDVQRVKTLRAEMGDNFILMADANRRYTAEKAAQISEILAPSNLLWFEEPTDYSENQMAKIKKNSKLPLALGENVLEEADFQKICDQHLTDYLQPDLPRCGGITGFQNAAEIALKNKIPLCSHLMPQLSISLVASFENGAWIEYDNLLPEGLFTQDISIQNGIMEPPKVPGTGVEITIESLHKFKTYSEVITP